MIRLKRVSSASSVRSLYVGTSLLQYASLLHRLTNDSSLARSAAEHAPDHDGAQYVNFAITDTGPWLVPRLHRVATIKKLLRLGYPGLRGTSRPRGTGGRKPLARRDVISIDSRSSETVVYCRRRDVSVTSIRSCLTDGLRKTINACCHNQFLSSHCLATK